jgi:D-glycero-alpha-D-manno-heptose-7-phosphate kinase
MRYESLAPTRIDFAGGTLDIWPIYVLEEGSITINAAINRFARVCLRKRNDRKIFITSKDFGKKIETSLDSFSFLAKGFELPLRVIKYFKPWFGFEMEIELQIPSGSGLGGSSSVAISIANLLNKLTRKNFSNSQLIHLISNIEAQVIKIPTGKQDYYPALYGGINAIYFSIDGVKCERLRPSKEFLKELNGRVILCYSGASRLSAITNWKILKRYIEGKGKTRKLIGRIKTIAEEMRDAFKSESLEIIGKLLDKEWENRKRLAIGITNKRTENIIKLAKSKGAIGAKVCGAGGGGCIIIFAKERKKEIIEKALREKGIKLIDFEFVRRGAQIKVER